MVATERFNRTDTSVTGQILKILSANPDAVTGRRLGHAGGVAAGDPGGARLQGRIYQTHGVANNDFLRVGARVSRARYCRSDRYWFRLNCRTAIRARKQRSNTSRLMKARTVSAALHLRRTHLGRGTDAAAGGSRSIEKAKPGTANSAPPCAMPWKV